MINRGKSKDDTSINVENKQTEKEAHEVIHLQKELVSKYIKSTPIEDKPVVFYYTMAPFSVLDPIYNPKGFSDPSALVNFLYGYYGSAFGVPEEKIKNDVTFPLQMASTFNEFEYFNVNKSSLNDMLNTVEDDPNLDILGDWNSSTILRINNAFVDTKRNSTWRVEAANNTYKYTFNQPNDSFDKQILTEKKKYDDLFKQMSRKGVQTVYKCDGKVIFIIFAVSDNAFGYIYNGTSGADANCGVLNRRFNIVEDQVINDKWRYWVAN